MPTAWTELARVAPCIALLLGTGCSGETRVSLFELADPLVPDAAGDGATSADTGGAERPPVRLPLHRYEVEGTGTLATDSAGSAHASLRGGALLDGLGGVVLDGQDDYIDLPNRLISGLNSATFVVWVEWYGGNCWHRIFDFGSTVQGEDVVGDAASNVFVTPLDCPGPGPHAMFGNRLGGVNREVVIRGPVPFSVNVEHQVALVVNGSARLMQLYIDAQSHGEATLQVGFDGIDDVNNWLGRSQWVQDRNFPGRYREFRIYDDALSAIEITRLYHLGPDVL